MFYVFLQANSCPFYTEETTNGKLNNCTENIKINIGYDFGIKLYIA